MIIGRVSTLDDETAIDLLTSIDVSLVWRRSRFIRLRLSRLIVVNNILVRIDDDTIGVIAQEGARFSISNCIIHFIHIT
nr:MAG TPA: hypothetical protein [Caudoviricetes sp.]